MLDQAQGEVGVSPRQVAVGGALPGQLVGQAGGKLGERQAGQGATEDLAFAEMPRHVETQAQRLLVDRLQGEDAGGQQQGLGQLPRRRIGRERGAQLGAQAGRLAQARPVEAAAALAGQGRGEPGEAAAPQQHAVGTDQGG